MMPRVVVVALDLNAYDGTINDFTTLPADEKIDRIKIRIQLLCEQLKEKEPNAVWLISWREYGITDSDSRSISNSSRIKLKKTMQELTKQYPNLNIIAGTVSTRKHLNTLDIDEINKRYLMSHSVSELEQKLAKPDDQQRLIHKNRIDTISNFNLGADVLRNTCYLFINGKTFFGSPTQDIQRHDKLAPFNETAENKNYPLAVYWHGKARAQKSTFEINYLRSAGLFDFTTENSFNVLIEICREHGLNVGLEQLKDKKIPLPLIHFVLSATCYLIPKNFAGNHVIHLDSRTKPRWVEIVNLDISEKATNGIKVYQNNIHAQNDNLLIETLDPVFYFDKDTLAITAEQQEKYIDELLKLEITNSVTKQFYFQLYIAIHNQRVSIVQHILEQYKGARDTLDFKDIRTDDIVWAAINRNNTEILDLIRKVKSEPRHLTKPTNDAHYTEEPTPSFWQKGTDQKSHAPASPPPLPIFRPLIKNKK